MKKYSFMTLEMLATVSVIIIIGCLPLYIQNGAFFYYLQSGIYYLV